MARFGREPVNPQYQVELAEKLYKYQNFKSSVIASKVQSDAYQGSSIVAFHSLLRKYLHSGQKDLQRATQAFYNEIDRVKSIHLGILTPSEDEKARPYTKHNFGGKGNSKVKIIKPKEDHSKLDKIINPNMPEKINLTAQTLNNIKLNQRSVFLALKLNDSLKTFKNEDEMNGYIKAYQDMDSEIKFEKVRITVETL